MREKSGLIISILVVLVVILLAVILYAFVFKPMLTGYVTGIYNQGATDASKVIVTQILTSVQQKGYVDIPAGNQTVRLAYVPSQAP